MFFKKPYRKDTVRIIANFVDIFCNNIKMNMFDEMDFTTTFPIHIHVLRYHSFFEKKVKLKYVRRQKSWNDNPFSLESWPPEQFHWPKMSQIKAEAAIVPNERKVEFS